MRSFVVPPPAGERWCRQAPKGGSRQAAFILAPKAPTTTLTVEGRVKPLNHLHPLNPHARQGVSMQAPKGDISSMRLWQDWPLTCPPPCPLRGTSPASGGRTTRAYIRATYERSALRSFVVPPLAGGRWCRKAPKGGRLRRHLYWRRRRPPQPSQPKAVSNL